MKTVLIQHMPHALDMPLLPYAASARYIVDGACGALNPKAFNPKASVCGRDTCTSVCWCIGGIPAYRCIGNVNQAASPLISLGIRKKQAS